MTELKDKYLSFELFCNWVKAFTFEFIMPGILDWRLHGDFFTTGHITFSWNEK